MSSVSSSTTLSSILDDSGQFPVYTHLKEIYPPSEIEHKYMPLFEDLRSKYLSLYCNQDPALIVSIPYTITLFGDCISKLFSDRIVSNTSNDLILLLNQNTTSSITIRFFDHILEITEPLTQPPNESNFTSSTKPELKDFLLYGYNSGVLHSKTTTPIGANILINLNTPSIENNIDVYITAFIGAFLSALCVNNAFPKTKNAFYDMASVSLGNILKYKEWNYYSSDLYFKIFLKKNNIGCFVNNTSSICDINAICDCNKYKSFVFDTFSPQPISYYSSKLYWNKRKVDCRLAMAVVLKLSNTDIPYDELIQYSNNFITFMSMYDNDIDKVISNVNTFLKETPYTRYEIKETIGLSFDILDLLKGIDTPEGALLSKEFELRKRLCYVINEYKYVMNVYNMLNNSNSSSNSNERFITVLNKSAENVRDNCECYSDEMKRAMKVVCNKYNDTSFKLISEGWCGNMIAIGANSEIDDIEKELTAYYEKYNEMHGDLVSMWISDDISRYCYVSKFNGGISFLNPKYEDFMLEYVKLKNTKMQELNTKDTQSVNVESGAK